MRRLMLSGLSGLLFGIGLTVARMTQPGKVIGFLDVAGHWDPSLALVMVGAIAVFSPLYWWLTRRPHAALGLEWSLPTRTDIDPRLIGGAALFGVGWGLGGFCPGPGITAAASGHATPLVFVAAMLAGMLLFERLHGTPLPAAKRAAKLSFGKPVRERTTGDR